MIFSSFRKAFKRYFNWKVLKRKKVLGETIGAVVH